MAKRLKEKGLKLVVTEEAKEFLIEKGSSLEFGARPLRRAIEQHLEDPLAEELLRGNFAGKDIDHGEGRRGGRREEAGLRDHRRRPAAAEPQPAVVGSEPK